jgi:hypothetical protein
MKKNGSLPKRERGQSLVEFAISLTAILILLAGAADFGIALFHYIAMRDAAQEGALYGSMNPGNTDEILSRAANSAGDGELIDRLWANGDGDLTIDIAYIGGQCEGDGITVTIEYPYPISMPFIGAFIGSDHINLRAAVTDTILTPPGPC